MAGGVAGGVAWKQHQHQVGLDAGARAAASQFAAAWSARKPENARYAVRSPQEAAKGFTTTTQGLGSGPVTVRLESFTRKGDQGSGQLSVAWALPGGSTWSYTDPVHVKLVVDRWEVSGDPSTSLWQPDIAAGAALTLTRTTGQRGDILDRSGNPLMTSGKVYAVQIDPARATKASVAALEKVVGEPSGSLMAKLVAAQKSGSQAPIPVISYREADFRAREPQLAPLPGVIYPPRSQPLAVSRTFGQPLLGSYGPVTAEMVKAGGGRYAAGDFAGTSGLQGRYDARLAGKQGLQVTVKGKPDQVLFEQKATDGKPVKLTLDPKVQKAAEKALQGSGDVPSALVAVDVKTGDLLAVANSPALGFDRALAGRYQPGSTLKVATTYSLLTHGLSPSTPVPCPPSVTVEGHKVRNYEGETFGKVPFSKDFAHSCNTAFVELALKMGDDDVHDAAKALGVGAGWADQLGVTGAFDGSVPVAQSLTEKAVSAFGQGRTLASPAALAVMAGSVARGSYIPPALVTAPTVAGSDRTPQPLDHGAVTQLQTLMREVVTDGTGTVLQSAPGGPVHAKTGTAEYGTKNPPQTRAWMVGWQGDVAFGVLVEEGRSGATVAGPIAKAFLTDLH